MNEWIECSVHKPGSSKRVLVQFEKGEMATAKFYSGYDAWDFDLPCYVGQISRSSNPVRWQPLSEPK